MVSHCPYLPACLYCASCNSYLHLKPVQVAYQWVWSMSRPYRHLGVKLVGITETILVKHNCYDYSMLDLSIINIQYYV